MCRVTDYLPMVSKIASKYAKGNRVPFDDIYQEGCVGLIKADREFDENGGSKFSTFAYNNITFAILTFLTRKSHLLNVSSDVVLLANRIRKAEEEEKPVEWLAEKYKVTEFVAKSALNYLRLDYASLEFEYNNKGRKKTLQDYTGYEDDFTGVCVNEIVDLFEGKKKMIIQLRLQGYTLQEIGDVCGMHWKTVSMTLSRCRTKIREKMTS